MTQDEIIEMAKQAGLEIVVGESLDGKVKTVRMPPINLLETFAKLVAEKEREACAKVCDDHWEKGGAAYYCAKTIRYRG